MPCYTFSYHGYATWMPDHRRGYVRRGHGIWERDVGMAVAYRRKQRETAVMFSRQMQETMIRAAIDAAEHLKARVHGVANEPTHVHITISWQHSRSWESIRASLRRALTMALNERFGKRTWFADSPSRKRVKDHEHFDYLMLCYIPKHKGAIYRDEADLERARERDKKRAVSVTKRRRKRVFQ